ncbi:MAG: hypothetical protein JXB43_06275 [Dehalococcoidia bacterium]|nr:hypothetical protein [Dehalococcoidia bacterium]
MIYLFNSAYRPLYQENLLATLFLPHGYTNEYRYHERNVPQNIIQEIEKINGKKEVVIIYIDRFGKDANNKNVYKYYPVRKAQFLSVNRESEQFYFRVKLLDFIYPKDLNSFSGQIVNSLSPDLPRLKDTPQNREDGYYVIKKASIFVDSSKFELGEHAWDCCVNDLYSKTDPFKSSDAKQIIFARLKLLETFPRTKEVHPHISNNPWYVRLLGKVNDGNAFYKVTMNRNYCFHMNYVYPIQMVNTNATAKLNIQFTDNVIPQTDEEITINSRASRIDFPLSFNEPTQHRFGTIKFKFSPDDNSISTIAPKRSMLFEIHYSKVYWIALIIIALLFAGTSIFIATDLSNVDNVGQYFISGTGLFKIIAAIFQAFILLWLSRLTSKKFL